MTADLSTAQQLQHPALPNSIYRALLDSLEPHEQQWVIAVVARQRQAERDGDLAGGRFPRAMR